MAGVVDGQSVSQAITNPAFLYKNANDTAVVVYTLAAPTSGPQVNDIQNTINVLINGVGGSQSTAATAYSSIPSNTIAQGDTLNVGVSKLARKFYGAASAGGHSHSGADGDGAPIVAVNTIAASGGFPGLQGDVIIAATGFADINQVGQTIVIAGLAPALADVLAVGNSASAGFDMAGGAIVDMSYTDWHTSGFPPGSPASAHVYFAPSANGFFYKKNASGTITRIEGTLAVSGQAAIYGDALLVPGTGVTLSQSGQNITISAAASGAAVNTIAASGSSGLSGNVVIAPSGGAAVTQSGQTITVYAPSAGVTSFAASGASALTGAVTISASGAVQLVETGQNIVVYAPSATSTTIAASGSSGLSGAVTISASGGAAVTQSGQNIQVFAQNDVNLLSGYPMTVAHQTIATQAIAASTIDWSTGYVFSKTLAASTTVLFTNPAEGQTIVVVLANSGTAYSVAWPTVKWSGGTAPTMSASATDVYTFLRAASAYYGSAVQNMS